MSNKKRCGISLITLVITIVVIIILAAVVIISLGRNNSIDDAKKATVLSDIDSFKSELTMSLTSMISNGLGDFVPTSVNAVEEEILEYIPSMKDKKIGGKKYTDIFIIVSGKLMLKEGYNINDQVNSKNSEILESVLDIYEGTLASGKVTVQKAIKDITIDDDNEVITAEITLTSTIPINKVIFENKAKTSEEVAGNGELTVKKEFEFIGSLNYSAKVYLTDGTIVPKNISVVSSDIESKKQYIFKNGNEYTDFTGGIVFQASTNAYDKNRYETTQKNDNFYIDKKDNKIIIETYRDGYSFYAMPKNDIDLSKYDKFIVKFSKIDRKSSVGYIVFSNNGIPPSNRKYTEFHPISEDIKIYELSLNGLSYTMGTVTAYAASGSSCEIVEMYLVKK